MQKYKFKQKQKYKGNIWWWRIFPTGCSVQRAFLAPLFLGVDIFRAPSRALTTRTGHFHPRDIPSPHLTASWWLSRAWSEGLGSQSRGLCFHTPSASLHPQRPLTRGSESVPGEEQDFSCRSCLTVHSEGFSRHLLWSRFQKLFFFFFPS